MKAKAIGSLRFCFAAAAAGLVIWLFSTSSETLETPLKDFFTGDFYQDTGAENAVAAIYLNYRIFDTLFESLMLMVSAMEVINVSWRNIHKEKYQYETNIYNRKANSEILLRMVGFIYPFVLMFGLYLIVNGHVSPGGGFQGGVILATALISRYLVYPNFDLNIELLETIEKLLFMFIVSTIVIYIFLGFQELTTGISSTIYMILMNALIGLKVFSGLSIIFYRFVFFE